MLTKSAVIDELDSQLLRKLSYLNTSLIKQLILGTLTPKVVLEINLKPAEKWRKLKFKRLKLKFQKLNNSLQI